MKRLLLTLALVALPKAAHADSPLTSTDFHTAYADVAMVGRAQHDGITAQVAAFLDDANNPIDVRLAMVNAMGWKIDGKHDADSFSRAAWGKPVSALNVQNLRGDELAVLGYLAVMDDYFHPAAGLALLEKAAQKMPRSFAVAAVLGLARAQRDMDKSFCIAGRDWSAVTGDGTLQRDMRQRAIAAIQSYMGEYTCP